MFFISWLGLGVFKRALELWKVGECPNRLPHNDPNKERCRQEPRPQKDGLQVVLEECKAKLMALCKQYCIEQCWRPPSGVVYKKEHKLVQRKLDHPSAKIWDGDDLRSRDESDSEGPQMSNRSPRESPFTMDGLPHEWELISSNSFCSPS